MGRHVRTLRFLKSSQNWRKLIPKALEVPACRERHHEVDVVITHELILRPGERDLNSCPQACTLMPLVAGLQCHSVAATPPARTRGPLGEMGVHVVVDRGLFEQEIDNPPEVLDPRML